jgi:regulator of protease activity HflC (stomatin/prohibitin superfamily)
LDFFSSIIALLGALLPWIIGVILILLVFKSVKILNQYERGLVKRFGRISPLKVLNPGLNFFMPFVDNLIRVKVAVQTVGLPSQATVTKDSVSIDVSAVMYFKVIDPYRAVVDVDNYLDAVQQRAQAVIRRIIGSKELNEVLEEGAEVAEAIEAALNNITTEWGVQITGLELKNVSLPEGMKRAMAAKAEATRNADAKVIEANGEFLSAQKLSEAARQLTPVALRLRELSVLQQIGTESATIIISDGQAGWAAAQAAAGGAAGINSHKYGKHAPRRGLPQTSSGLSDTNPEEITLPS